MSKVKEVNDSKKENEEILEKPSLKENAKDEEVKTNKTKTTTKKSTGTKSKTVKTTTQTKPKSTKKETSTAKTDVAKKVATKEDATKEEKTTKRKTASTKPASTKQATTKTTSTKKVTTTKTKKTSTAKTDVAKKVTNEVSPKSSETRTKKEKEVKSKKTKDAEMNVKEVAQIIDEETKIELKELQKENDENFKITTQLNIDNELDETKPLEENVARQEEKIIKDKTSHKKKTITLIVAVVLLVAIMMFSTMFAIISRKSNKIVSNIYVQGVSISELTKEDAKATIEKMYNNKLQQDIKLQYKDYDISLIPEQIEAKFGVDEVIDMVYNIGRSGKLLKDNYAILNAKINKTDIKPSFTYDEKLITDFIENTSENLPDKVEQSSYSINGDKLIITKGKKGYTINQEELKKEILNNIIELKPETEIIEIPVSEVNPDKIDLQKIHDEIYKEAKDAYYTKNPFTVYPHVDGVDFAVTMEEANNLLNNNEKEIVIPLKITKPKVTVNQIGQEAFPDLLATYSTTFSTSNTNRSTNIRLAVNKINGVVVMPGKQFSYNAVLGQRTASAGYKTAAVYVSGRVENGIGGGICQVSSTLYNTALRANLEIVKRSNHMFATGYVPLSTDATVSWGGPEFIFKNSRKYPIRIVASVNGGRIKVDIYGHKEDVEYEVVIKSETIQTIPMQTEYRNNPSLPKGTTKTVQKGHGGYKSRAYRILKQNGKVVSTQLLSTDTYRQLSTIIEKN